MAVVEPLLAFIVRGLEYRDRDVLLQFHRALVSPHLEYCVQFWCPYLRKDALVVKGIQQRFTRLIPGMAGLAGLYSLGFRRVRGDFIEPYKILTGLDRIDSERMFPMVGSPKLGVIV